MKRSPVLATGAVALALAAALALAVASGGAAVAAAGSTAARAPAVTVRVEGTSRTLLLPTLLRTHAGSITRYGAPKGACPATSGQGALDVATHHRWKGKWTTQFGPEYEITSILGETHSFSSKFFWEIFADNVAATTGACEIKLHRGEQLLFAAVPQSGIEYPLGLSAPHTVVSSKSFPVKVVWFDAKGKPKPLAGARVSGSGVHAVTDRHGIATVRAPHTGTLVLHAAHKGYVRPAPLAVLVS